VSTLYKIECDLFDDQSECWPADLLFLPRAGIDTMLDILVEGMRRKLAVNPLYPTAELATIRENMHIVTALEGEAARAYFAQKGLDALEIGDVRRAHACAIWQRTLELEVE